MLALAAAVVLSQIDVYTWVDDQGVTHFTDGATGVPEYAEKTEVGKVSVLSRVPGNLPKPAPQPSNPAPRKAEAQVVVREEPKHQPENPLPQFTYVQNWAEHEGLGVYYRFDALPPPLPRPPRRPYVTDCPTAPVQAAAPAEPGARPKSKGISGRLFAR